MPAGLPWTESLISQISDKDVRHAYVADQVRLRIALMIRSLREQEGREWSQARLGREMGKPQSVISRLEDPDYGRQTLETLLEVAEAFDLPLLVDIPEWEDWFKYMDDLSSKALRRASFSAEGLIAKARSNETNSETQGALDAFIRASYEGQRETILAPAANETMETNPLGSVRDSGGGGSLAETEALTMSSNKRGQSRPSGFLGDAA